MKKEMATKSAFGESVKTYIERGELVPDDIVLPVVKKILTQPTYKSGSDSRWISSNGSTGRRYSKITPDRFSYVFPSSSRNLD